MAKDELMELGNLFVQSELNVLYIKDIQVHEAVNAHGKMELCLLPGQITAEDTVRYQDTPIQVVTRDGVAVFCGICKAINLQSGNNYSEVKIVAYTNSILTDREKKSRTFQAGEKSLDQVMQEGIGTQALVSVDQDISISEMLSQEQETDWYFDRRIANQYQKQVFVNGKSAGCQIHVGVLPFQEKELGMVEDVKVSRNVDAVRAIQGNTMPGASVFEFETTTLKIRDLSIGVGYAVNYQGRQQIVIKSEIYSSRGAVWNEITLSNKEGVVPSVGSSMGSLGRNSILTGEVLAVSGTMVQVDFHSPGDSPRWIPYAAASSNYFYSMPDEGDTVYVYYETGDSDRIVCLGSKHVNDSPDFGNHQNKMLTANNRMIQFSEKDVSVIGNRKEFDGEGGEQAKITFNDENGIEIQSTKDIEIKTTDGGNITIQSVKGSFAGIEAVKNAFVEKYQEGDAKYKADGGNTEFNALEYLAKAEFGKLVENIMDNITSPLQVIGTVQELGDRIGGGGGDGGAAGAQGEAPVFSDGIVDISALKRLVIQVGSSCVTFADGIIQIKSNTYMQLGTDRTVSYEHLEDANYTWRDMVLDVTQCALDIVGVLPIPGVSTAANLVNAGISFARGDYIGAAVSAGTAALSVIGANTLKAPAAVAKTASKVAKATEKAGKIVSAVKRLASGAESLNMALTTGMAAWDLGAAVLSGEFDLNDPDCRQDLAMVLKGGSSYAKGGIEKKKAKNGGDGKASRAQKESEGQKRKEGRKQKGQQDGDGIKKANNSDGERLNQDSDTRCKNGEPIDMVTGSYLIEQCDFIINDITGIFAVERTYESLLCTEDSPIGKGWTLSLFSRAVIYDDRIEIILPDNHTETFLKTAEGYRNRRGGSKKRFLEQGEHEYRMWESGSKICRVYDYKGKLISVMDRNGNKTIYQYSGDTLEKILFSSGQYLTMGWEGTHLISMQDCIGRTVRYHYDGNLLVQVEMVNGGVERYTYDYQGRVMEITNANGITYVHNEYDAQNRVTRQKLYTGQEYILLYADDDRTNTYIAAENQKQIRYKYNKDKQLVRTEYLDGTFEAAEYDAWGNRIMERDRRGYEIRRRYDEFGNLLEECLPDGLVRSYKYDGEGNCVQSWDNTGLSSWYTYDENGNLKKEIQKIDASMKREVAYEYDKFGRITSFTDGNGNQERYQYIGNFSTAESFTTAGGNLRQRELDRAGRCVTVTDAAGTSSFAYNHFDIMCMETNPLGFTTRYVYDGTVDLVRVIKPNHYNPYAGRETGENYQYDAFHNQLSRTDETGAVFAVCRDGERNITKEINPNDYNPQTKDGDGIEYRYDVDDRAYLRIEPDGGKERRWYDAAGNLVRVCLPEQYDEKADDGEGYSYEYDAMNRLIQVTGPDGRVKKRYVYDLHGNLCKEIDGKGMLTGDTDESRIGTHYLYNYVGWLLERRVPVKVENGKVLYQLVRYQYDMAGNRIEEKRYCDYQTEDSSSGVVHTIHYEYDKDDQLIRVSDSTGAVLEYGYDSRGKRVYERRKISDSVSQVFRYRYDEAGRMTELNRTADREGSGCRTAAVRYEYDKNDNLVRVLLPSRAEILREYDAVDRLVRETHLDEAGGINNTTCFAYDKAGNLICITDNQGRKTQIEYDKMNREIRRMEKDGGVTRKFYDRNGYLAKEIRPNEYAKNREEGAGFSYTYDSEGRILTVLRPDGKLQESNTYDADGLLLQTLDGLGNGVAFTYDFGERRTKLQTMGQASQEYEYDAMGNVIGLTDGAGNRTEYALDSWGRICEIRKADGSSEYYSYDYAGNVTRSIDGEGNQTLYEYNAVNQLAAITDPMGGREIYLYDLEDRLCRKTDRNGVETRYTYNLYGNLLTRQAEGLSEKYEYTPEGLLKSAISEGMRYSYRYDAMGRLREKQASGRQLLSFAYDWNGNKILQKDVTGKVTEYRYDVMDQLSEVWDCGRKIAEYAYNLDGTVRSLKNGDSLYTEYAYDADQNLTGLKMTLGTEILMENHYCYDGNGNRTEKRQPAGLTRYYYDSQNRLKAVEYPGRREELFYDKAGNRSRRVVNGLEEIYTYDKRNRLTERRQGNEAETYVYDNAGNLIQDNRAGYVYDAFNRMEKAETFDGHIQVNHYDAEGLRYEMEENGNLVQFIFHEGEIAAEQAEENTTRYIRGGELLASDAEHARTYYHYASDEMGSITHVTAGEDILNWYEYDAWGNVVQCGERVENHFRFNGQQYDDVTQQYYLRARFYNPVIGRFTQEDIYRGDGLNLYVYCQNNPVYFIDPSGYAVICKKRADEIIKKVEGRGANKQEVDSLRRYLREIQRSGKRLNPSEKDIAKKLGVKETKNNHHKMKAYLIQGEKRESYFYESGGLGKNLKDPRGLLSHTERKFLKEVRGEVNSGDQLKMYGELEPCRGGCQPAIRRFVSDKNVTVSYHASLSGNTYTWTPFSHENLKGFVLQTVKDENGKVIGSRRYWKRSSGIWSSAEYEVQDIK